jgi:prepilin-type N-terminal cleavage/methylation domain-containing protein
MRIRIGSSAVQLTARPQQGFTLIELGVVVLVVALLLGSVLVPLGSQVKQRNKAETQRIIEEARQALIGYAMINGRLPRPSDSATNGAERGACTTQEQCTGFIPWATLGIAPVDAWGKVPRYSVNSNYAGGTSGTAAITTALFTSTAGERIVKTRTADGTEINLATNVPAVILSHGERNLGTSADGTPFPDSPNANADEDANAAAGATTFYSRAPSDNPGAPGGEFDDQVVWIPSSQLFSQLVSAGRLP